MLEFEGRQIPNELKEIVDPSRTVLLVWDMQNDQAGGAFNKDALIRNAPPLIAAAGQAGIKTIYTRQTPYLWKDESPVWIHRFMKDKKSITRAKLKPRRLHGSFGWHIMEPFKPARRHRHRQTAPDHVHRQRVRNRALPIGSRRRSS